MIDVTSAWAAGRESRKRLLHFAEMKEIAAF
jgi:hypothetical protein